MSEHTITPQETLQRVAEIIVELREANATIVKLRDALIMTRNTLQATYSTYNEWPEYEIIESLIKSESKEDFIVKEDMICPVNKEHCSDECCTVGSVCNVSGNEIKEPSRPTRINGTGVF